jgi:hypothetical protein
MVLQTQARNRHPYDAAADEVELAVNAWLLHHKPPWKQKDGQTHSRQAADVSLEWKPSPKPPVKAAAAAAASGGAGCNGGEAGGGACGAADHNEL